MRYEHFHVSLLPAAAAALALSGRATRHWSIWAHWQVAAAQLERPRAAANSRARRVPTSYFFPARPALTYSIQQYIRPESRIYITLEPYIVPLLTSPASLNLLNHVVPYGYHHHVRKKVKLKKNGY